MKKWLGRIGIVLGVLVLLLIGSWVWIWTAPPPELEVGPDTTVIEQPLRDDGTVDYIAALNQRYSEGVTPENNAFVIIAQLMPPNQWDAAAVREKTFEQLGVAMPDEEAAYLEPFNDYAADRAAAEASEGGDDAELSQESKDSQGSADQEDQEEPEAAAGVPDAMSMSAAEPPPWEAEHERAMEGPWSRADAPLVADWLDEQQPILDAVVEAANRQHYWSPYVTERRDDVLFSVLMPHLQTLRMAADGLRVRAFHRLHEGDVDGAIEDVLAIRRLAMHMTETPTLIEQMVGVGIAAVGAEGVAVMAAQEALTADQARVLDRALREIYRPFDLSVAMDVGERYFVLDVMQHPGRNASHVADLGGLDISGVTSRMDPNRAMRRINAFYDRLTDAAAAPIYAERAERLTQIDDETEQRMRALTSPSLTWAAIAMGNRAALTDTVTDLVTALLAPSLLGAATHVEHAEAHHRLEIIALALAGYRAEHGQYPTALEDLTPEWLDEVPVDLFDPDEKPLRYRVDDESVLIYSVGPNGEDDDGQARDGPEEDDDIAFELPRHDSRDSGEPPSQE